ncbi:PAS domain S-box protein [Sulfurimonas sp.]|uniref:SpoIIE family protein phosphatase n=1 Tax=Sulfurimonas sp. TaxID=2022749 RepID=UPI0035694EE3
MKKKLLLRQYQNMVDETNIVSKTDINGRITYVNSKFMKVSGYTEDELIGKSHSLIRDPDMPSEVFKNLWETIKSKNVWHGVVTNRSKDGSKYTVEASIFPILDENDEIVEYISIRHDITELKRLNKKLDDINKYKSDQENLAKEKLESGIKNDLNKQEYEVIYKPSDIVSGDFYSMYKMKNGSTFIYVIDGQGHGISPALTVFGISSMLNYAIHKVDTLEELVEKTYHTSKSFLAENEQISYSLIVISQDKKTITYSSGGMYPFLIKTKDEVLKLKANNTPFMNFSEMPKCDTVKLDDWESLMIYTDGIIEHEHESLKHHIPDKIIEDSSSIVKSFDTISSHEFEDDVTLIYLRNL